MQCPNCGAESDNSAVTCPCGYDFRTGSKLESWEKEIGQQRGLWERFKRDLSLSQYDKRFVDEHGFVRKHPWWNGLYWWVPLAMMSVVLGLGIPFFLIGLIVGMDDSGGMLMAGLLLYPFTNIFLGLNTRGVISYVPGTWRHTESVLNKLGKWCLLLGPFVLIVYERWKDRERQFLARHR